MKLIRDYQFSPDNFYDYLEKEILGQIAKATKKKFSVLDIKGGFTYTIHSEKTNVDTTVKIKNYSRETGFNAIYINMGEEIEVNYIAKPNKNGSTIIMQQKVLSYDYTKHNKIVNSFNNFIFLRRMQDQLNQMANQVLANIK